MHQRWLHQTDSQVSSLLGGEVVTVQVPAAHASAAFSVDFVIYPVLVGICSCDGRNWRPKHATVIRRQQRRCERLIVGCM
ncbi:unnamed protein product [Linum trigynum]|uniref:Uncharacterized protein n=1 Tax=Linum trigynum TaxID=586398 RepID=A0AAV2DGA6_9ROSI